MIATALKKMKARGFLTGKSFPCSGEERQSLKSGQKGFTLIEAVISLAVFAIAVLAITSLSIVQENTGNKSNRLDQAVLATKDRLEWYRIQPLNNRPANATDSCISCPSGVPQGTVVADAELVNAQYGMQANTKIKMATASNPTGFRRRMDVDPPFEGEADEITPPSPDLVYVRVWVTWTDSTGNHKVQMGTYVYSPGF